MKKLDCIQEEMNELENKLNELEKMKKICEYNYFYCYDDSTIELDVKKLEEFTDFSRRNDASNTGKLIIILPEHIKNGFEIEIEIHINELSVVAAALSRINNITYEKWLFCVNNIPVEKAYFTQDMILCTYTELLYENIKNPYHGDQIFIYDDSSYFKTNEMINKKRDELESIINEKLNK